MTIATRSLKVFLCNADEDQKVVFGLYNQLKNNGVDVWLAEEKLLPGDDREREIRKAVRNTDVVAVCLSNYFNQAGGQQKEVRIALDAAQEKLDGQIFIIPIRLEMCEVPDSLHRWQYVDIFDPRGYEKLTLALRKRANDLGITLQFKKSQLQVSIKAEKDKVKVTTAKKNHLGGSSWFADSDTAQPTSTLKFGLNTAIIVALIGCAVTIIVALLTPPIIAKLLLSTPTPIIEITASLEPTFTPSSGEIPFPTPKSISPISSDPFIGRDGMRLIEIPAGEFLMGSKGNAPDEGPVRMIYLDAFLLDQTEVTNGMYALCVESNKCDAPKVNTSIQHNEGNNSFYYGNTKFDDYPVIYVSWDDAKAYCKWAGRRLPTESEWEKAASWDDDQKIKRLYPWGNKIDCSYANYYGAGDNLCVGDTVPVGSYAQGASFYGVLDMAGNVWEWVADRYDHEFYQNSDPDNPMSISGNSIVIRGGSFLTGRDVGVRSSDRDSFPPDSTSHNLGFRCAMDNP